MKISHQRERAHKHVAEIRNNSNRAISIINRSSRRRSHRGGDLIEDVQSTPHPRACILHPNFRPLYREGQVSLQVVLAMVTSWWLFHREGTVKGPSSKVHPIEWCFLEGERGGTAQLPLAGRINNPISRNRTNVKHGPCCTVVKSLSPPPPGWVSR